jgi:hypothetical protein
MGSILCAATWWDDLEVSNCRQVSDFLWQATAVLLRYERLTCCLDECERLFHCGAKERGSCIGEGGCLWSTSALCPQGMPVHTRGSERLQSSHMYRQWYLTFWCSSPQNVRILRRYRRNLVAYLGIHGRKSGQLRIKHSAEASPLAERSPALIVAFIRSSYSATTSSREIHGLDVAGRYKLKTPKTVLESFSQSTADKARLRSGSELVH